MERNQAPELLSARAIDKTAFVQEIIVRSDETPWHRPARCGNGGLQ